MSEHIQAKNNRVFFSERITFVIMTLHLNAWSYFKNAL